MTGEPIILHIETATEVCSAALTRGKQILCVREDINGHSHSHNLLPFIDSLLKQADCPAAALQAVAVSIGPGSYTGLRIGASAAKGIAYALGIPVITIDTLESIAQGAYQHFAGDAACQYVPMIDARRMEVYSAVYDNQMHLLEAATPVVVDEQAFGTILADNRIVFCGNGMPKCRDLLSRHPNACFADFTLSARYMLPAALRKWEKEEFADVAYFEPFYLKDYVAAKPNVKGLH